MVRHLFVESRDDLHNLLTAIREADGWIEEVWLNRSPPTFAGWGVTFHDADSLKWPVAKAIDRPPDDRETVMVRC